MSGGAPAIEAVGLSRSFGGTQALTDLTLDVAPGEVLALLGPNGAGKTTTVRLLNGVLAPDTGHSRVLGLDPAISGRVVRRRTGVVTDNAGLDERLTALENLETVAVIRGLRRPEARRRSSEMLDRFGMSARRDSPVQGFSTGERKRVALARALLHDPEVLFLDEPTSGLDPAATREVIELIATLAGERGRTVVLCTHFLGEAGRLAHRMAVLDRGRLLAAGRPADLGAQLWPGIGTELELGGPADEQTVSALSAVRGVLSAEATPDGARVQVQAREVVAEVVAALVSREIPVYAAVPRAPTVEDVYFALHQRLAGSVQNGGGEVSR